MVVGLLALVLPKTWMLKVAILIVLLSVGAAAGAAGDGRAGSAAPSVGTVAVREDAATAGACGCAVVGEDEDGLDGPQAKRSAKRRTAQLTPGLSHAVGRPWQVTVQLDHVHPAHDLLAGFPMAIVSVEGTPTATPSGVARRSSVAASPARLEPACCLQGRGGRGPDAVAEALLVERGTDLRS